MNESQASVLEPPALRESTTILCVDDDAAILASLRRALKREPYEILTASTAEEALEVLGRRDVKLVVADQRLPGMCGSDLLAQIRQRFPRTQRVMLTGYPGNTRVNYGLGDEIEWLISKPWNDDALRVTLRQLIESGSRSASKKTSVRTR